MAMATLRRPLATYRDCTPEAVSGGSKAQMRFFVEDAKADIAALAGALIEAQNALEWVRANYASGSTKEINERIDSAINAAEPRS